MIKIKDLIIGIDYSMLLYKFVVVEELRFVGKFKDSKALTVNVTTRVIIRCSGNTAQTVHLVIDF